MAQQYITSLRAHNGKRGKGKDKKVKELGGGRGKKKGGGSYQLLRLDKDSDEDGEDKGDEDDEDLQDEAQRFFEVLSSQLKTCEVCGPTVFCKITAVGTHKHLTVQQMKAWAMVRFCS